jgi:hypothetical protein
MLIIGMVFLGTSKFTAAFMVQNSISHSTMQNTSDPQPAKGMVHSAACIVVCVGVETTPQFEMPKKVDFVSFLMTAVKTLQLNGRIPPPAKHPPKLILIV